MSVSRKHLVLIIALMAGWACGQTEQERQEEAAFEAYCTRMVECGVEETVTNCVEKSKETLVNFRMYEHEKQRCKNMPEHFLKSLCIAEELSCEQIRRVDVDEATCAADVKAVGENTIFCINAVGF